jgi:hypothetical protein
MPFLTKGKKLVVKGGKFVTTDDPKECQCCDAEKPCGTATFSGGAGVTIKNYEMPAKAGNVKFSYNAYTVPDAFKVEGGGQVFIDTGDVQGAATRTFFKPEGLRKVKVTVTGPVGTGWNYEIGCPEDNPLP